MKSPEEIKQGIECCYAMNCNCLKRGCPYIGMRLRHDHVLKDARDYIQQLEAKVPRWISVEERRPEVNDDVLVFVQHPISGHCWTQIAHRLSAMELDECDEYDEWWLDGSGATVRYITHWMPLPEPPEVTKP